MKSRSALPVLFGVVVVDLIGFGVVMPVLPFYARDFGASATQLGWVLTAYAAAQFACAPLWGRLSDRVGRRPVMLTTISGTALALLLLGLADSLWAVVGARLLAGAFAANVSVAAAYVTDVTEERERTRYMGLLGACFGVGFLLGPAIGGLLSPYGHHVPMLAAAGLAALNALHAAFALRDPPRTAAATPGAVPVRTSLLRVPRVRLVCAANLVFALSVTQLETLFAFFAEDRFGLDARQVAFVLVGMAVVMGGIQGGGMRALAARVRERTLVLGGCALLALSFAAVPLAPGLPALLAVLGVSAVGRAVAQPSLMSLASLLAEPERRGAVMGLFQSSASLARIVGPLAAGALYDRSLAAPFWLAAGLAAAVILLARGLPRGAGAATDAASPPVGA